jgi:hypothetical protein
MIKKIKEVYARGYGSPAAEMAELLEALGLVKYDPEPGREVLIADSIHNISTPIHEDEMIRALREVGYTVSKYQP